MSGKSAGGGDTDKEDGYGLPCDGHICNVVGQLADGAAQFGRLPNMSSWVRGDLLLFRSRTDLGAIGAAIVAAQRSAYPNDHADWTHAAVYAGDGDLIEADFDPAGDGSGIFLRSVSRYVPDYWIRVRRDPRLTESERSTLVAFARNLLGRGYSLERAFQFAYAFASHDARLDPRDIGGESPHPGPPTRGYVCSDVYAAAYGDATGKSAAPDSPEFVSPAALSVSPMFSDVAVDWCVLPQPGTADLTLGASPVEEPH